MSHDLNQGHVIFDGSATELLILVETPQWKALGYQYSEKI